MSKKLASLFVLVAILVALIGVIPVASQDGDRPSDADWSAEPVAAPSVPAPVVERPLGEAPQLGEPTAIYSNKGEDEDKGRASTDVVLDPTELEAVPIIVVYEEGFDASALEAASGSKVVHRYEKVFTGASMIVSGDKLDKLDKLPGVKKVYLDTMEQPDTDSSPEFTGAAAVFADMGIENAGEGVIVGILDTGIWPEHPSFADDGSYPPPPVGGLACDFGNAAYNPHDVPFACNNKLIGAYAFIDTYKAYAGLDAEDFDSARDADGHGTHTSSTAAGNAGVAASIFGMDRGTVSGMAPRAHVIMYKVCGFDGCYGSDSAAAVEQAILNGVDAINFSIGGGTNPYSDFVSNAFLAAYENGVFVSCSAGNSGPDLDTTGHREPWTITVGASSQDRFWLGELYLENMTDTVTLSLDGSTIMPDLTGTHKVVFATDVDPTNANCNAPFPANSWTEDEIVLCSRTGGARVLKSYNTMQAGAAGMVLYHVTPMAMMTDNHWIPSIQLDHIEGAKLVDYMDTYSNTTVYGEIYTSVPTDVGGNMMTDFSSRGGPGQSLGLSKPDVTAPGTQILAGTTPAINAARPVLHTGPDGELFMAIAGTSMSSPHVAGAGALLKSLHPEWTPGMIKSALMTTARPDVTKYDGPEMADAFDYGSGHIAVDMAAAATLFFHDTGANFLATENNLWDANLPSAYFPVMPGQVTFYREAFISQHTESPEGYWRWWTETPDDVSVKVTLGAVDKGFDGDRLTFKFVVNGKKVPLGEVRFAHVYFEHIITGELHHFPITFVRDQWPVTLEKDCTPQEFPLGGQNVCTITVENNTFDPIKVKVVDKLPKKLELVPGSVVGAKEVNERKLRKTKTLTPQSPPLVHVADGTGNSPVGYLTLEGYTDPDAHTDESCLTYNLPVPYEFAGEFWWSIGMVSNGYAVVGGCSGNPDIQFINQVLPEPDPPNNVLAPFWTDLNPEFGGNLYLDYVSFDGWATYWLVLEWQDVRSYGDVETNSFQIWIYSSGGEEIYYTYGSVGDGDGGLLTVGAENEYGNEGENWYADGTGTLVTEGDEVQVWTEAGLPGESLEITFNAEAEGTKTGWWLNCAKMTSDDLYGTTIDCFRGKILPVE